MIQIEEKENTVFSKASEKLDDADYDQLLPLLRKKIDEYGEINWYFEMEDFKGWSFNAFWRDLQFDFKNRNCLRKVAMVGENKWQEVMTDVLKPFTDAEIRYFNEDKATEARHWIES